MQGFNPKVALRFAVLSMCATAVGFLSGCAGMTGTAAPNSFEISGLGGSLHGGIQAIVGAQVYLYAANITGYHGDATSLITPGSGGTATDGSGHAYVTTDSHGSFSYGGTFTCPSASSQIYLLATGGNSGGSGTNSAIALSAAIGDCSSINSSTFTNISEATTVAMTYALNGFMTSPTKVGAPASNVAGLKAAFATAGNLVDSSTGAARTTTPGGNGTVPRQNINTLSNILAACVNSSSSSDANCTGLFSNTAVPATPTETLTAALHIAALPGANVTNLYALAAPVNSFQPALSSQPNDFSLGITFSPTGLTAARPGAVVIDAGGNIWMANCKTCTNPAAVDQLLEFSSTGAFLHAYSGSSNASTQVLHGIQGIAIDASGSNIYTINQGVSGGGSPGTGDDQLIKMSTSTGAVQSGFPVDFDQATYGVQTFSGIAVDKAGEIWVTAPNTGAVVEITSSGNLLNGSPFFVGETRGVAVDNLGYSWFAGGFSDSIIVFDTDGNYLQNFAPSSLNNPTGIAINSSNEAWVVNTDGKSISRLDPGTGEDKGGSPYKTLSLNQVSLLAIDGTNQVLIPNCRKSCASSGSTAADGVVRISSAGASNVGTTGAAATMQVSGLNIPSGVAVDAAGNAWITNNGSGTLTQVVGFASPTRQPLAGAALAGKIGQLP